MATVARRETNTLNELLFKQHARVNTYQLMRLLLLGQDSNWSIDQRLRFRADLSGAFPGQEFTKVSRRKNRDPRNSHGEVIDIVTANYCVASVLGPLPEPFTEWVGELERAHEPAMADFLNIFNQRLNVLRYKLKAADTIGLNNAPPAETWHAHALAALMGLSSPKLAQQLPLHPRAWMALAGLLSNARKCASTITQVLAFFLHSGVTLKPMVGAWQQIEQEDRIALGQKNHTLGRRSILGRRVWDQQARVRLCIGPISYQRLCQLLPPRLAQQHAALLADDNTNPARSSSCFQGFTALLRLLLDNLVDCEIELEVTADSIPESVLISQPRDNEAGLRLRQTAWLHSRPRKIEDQASSYRSSYLVRAHEYCTGMEAA